MMSHKYGKGTSAVAQWANPLPGIPVSHVGAWAGVSPRLLLIQLSAATLGCSSWAPQLLGFLPVTWETRLDGFLAVAAI